MQMTGYNNMKLNTTKTSSLLRALFLTVLVGTLWACTNKDIDIPTTGITGSDESTVAFTVKIPSGGIPKLSTPTTYALSADDENEVNHIAVLLFETNGKYTYQPIYVSGSKITGDGQEKTFTVNVPEGTYDMVMLANANQSLSSVLSTIKGQDKATVLNKLIVTNNDKWNADSSSTGYVPIPMWGEARVEAVNGTTVNVDFSLVRMLAKIDVALTSSAAKDVFNLQSVRLYNYNNQGQIVPTSTNWSSSTLEVTNPTIPSTADKADSPLLYNGTAITKEMDRGVSCINEIYTFEATAGEYSSLATNTCLVIGGIYGNESKTIYYRIDFANTAASGGETTTTYLPLLRNHNYKVNITNIYGYGFASPEDAFKAGPINIEASVLNWDNAQITEIAYDGQHMLGVSSTEFTFTKEARIASSTDNILSIYTDIPTGWKVENTFCETGGAIDWLNLSAMNGNSGVTTNSKIILSENTTGVVRTGFIQLSAGNLTFMIKVQQLAKAKDILITNKEGEPITTLEFAAKKDEKPLAQEFNVSWPHDLTLSYINTPTGNPFLFDTGVGFESIPVNGTISNSTGEKPYTISPPAITSDELALNPFYERVSNIMYSIPSGSEVINKMVSLRQYAYNAVPVVDNVYLMDGSRKSFGVRSNTDFEVEIKNNPGGVITKIHPVEGTPNTSAEGTRVYFDIDNKMDNPTPIQSDIIFTVKSTSGLFPDFDVALNCISFDPEPESNSYILPPSSKEIYIPVSRANASDLLPQPQLSKDETFTAELVWTDNSNKISADSNIKSIGVSGTGPEGYLLVEPGSAEGNAVVAIKKGGKILWSWHIWVTKEEPSVLGEHGFMDRNLGAIGNTPGTVGAKGLLYQWGRKDPFPGSTSIDGGGEPTVYTTNSNATIEKTNVATMDLTTNPNGNNFANSVANPATYYFNNAEPYNWYTNCLDEASRNDILWDDGSRKTIYDPCPAGWRVPKNGVWDGLSTSNFTLGNSGRTADSHGGFYPAAGYRNRNSGNFNSVGSVGYYWSATVNGRYACGLTFRSSSVGPSNGSYGRAYGFSVRCVQE